MYRFRSRRGLGGVSVGLTPDGRSAAVMDSVEPLAPAPLLLPDDAALQIEADYGDDLDAASGEILTGGDVLVQARDALLPGFAPLDVTVELVAGALGAPAPALVVQDEAGIARSLRVTVGPGARPGQLYRVVFLAYTSQGRTIVGETPDIASAPGVAEETAPELAARGHTTVSQVTVPEGEEPVLLLAANAGRQLATIINNGSGAVLYIGATTEQASVDEGLPVHAGQPARDRDGIDAWYGVSGSGDIDVRVLEVAT